VRRGTGHLAVGAFLLAGGIGVTMASTATVWYGAIIVGALEVARGTYQLMRSDP
jgi:hypothetical protein